MQRVADSPRSGEIRPAAGGRSKHAKSGFTALPDHLRKVQYREFPVDIIKIPGGPLPGRVDRDASRQVVDDLRVSFANALNDAGALRRQDKAVAKSGPPQRAPGELPPPACRKIE